MKIIKPKKIKIKKRKSFFDMLTALSEMSVKNNKKGKYELSDDDKIIYGI